MNIAFLFTFLGETGGIPRLENAFLPFLGSSSDHFSLITYTRNVAPSPSSVLYLERGKMFRNIQRMRAFNRKEKIEITFYHYHTFPLFLCGIPYIIEIHDTNPLKNFISGTITIINAIFSRGIIVPSESTKRNLSRFFSYFFLGKIISHKIYVVPNPFPDDFKEMLKNPEEKLIEKFYLKKKEYFFTLGSDDLNFICEAHQKAKTNTRLVIGGKVNESKKEELGRKYNVIFTGFLEERDLSSLYAFAKAMIYKNKNEGFGYIPLEAVISGTPVITNPDMSIREVLGDSGLYYENQNECARLIQEINMGNKRVEFDSHQYAPKIIFEEHILVIKNLAGKTWRFGEWASRLLQNFSFLKPILIARRNLIVKLKSSSKRIGEFTYKGIPIPYTFHIYNSAYANERKIEISIGKYWLNSIPNTSSILEIGNVLSHYVNTNHLVVDKYEKDGYKNLVNEDILYFKPNKKYDFIISISTLEHVGYDEIPKDPEKVLRVIPEVINNLLVKNGKFLITVPWGYNPCIDKIIMDTEKNKEIFGFPVELTLYRREKERWNIAKDTDAIRDSYYGVRYNCANAIAVLEIKNI